MKNNRELFMIRQLTRLRKRLKEAEEILRIASEIHGECDQIDHHGSCQTHNLQPIEECWVRRTFKWLENES